MRKHAKIHPGFETQGRYHQKPKTGVSVAPRKELMSSKILKNKTFSYEVSVSGSCLRNDCGIICSKQERISANRSKCSENRKMVNDIKKRKVIGKDRATMWRAFKFGISTIAYECVEL